MMKDLIFYMRNVISAFSRGDFLSVIYILISYAAILFLLLPVHELAHAFVANKLGDPTAKRLGRLTFNPLASIDPIGAISMFVVGIGWAKPVPINPNNFKNKKTGMALTAVAGPAINLLVSLILILLANLILRLTMASQIMALMFIADIFMEIAYMSIFLAVFNLLPIPPLDGSKFFTAFLPDNLYFSYIKGNTMYMYILLALVFMNMLDSFLGTVTNAIYGTMMGLGTTIFF